MKDIYRQRATKAEQENQRLLHQLAHRPQYEWFVELIRKNLSQASTVSPSHLAQQVKQLKNSRGGLVEDRLKTAEALENLLWPNMAIGNKATIQAAINLLKGENLNGGDE